MAELCGSSCGLVLFSAMIVRGLAAGNPADAVLWRALGGLALGFILGAVAGVVAARIVADQPKGKTEAEDREPGKDDSQAAAGSAA